ncbi:N-ethylammeline chlorohydrolase [Chromatiales bacterium (ex Bugula neritina AB1)]|nr:N-ethylammeline chlorohydrolase [Chromatiales bacterium (ex Bugula neritina AB1)]
MNTEQFAITPRWVICVDAENRVLENHAVIVNADKIAAVVPWPEAQSRYHGIQVIDLPEQALMPGLINAHTHMAMNLLRGFADDLPLMTWLSEHIWPAEGQHVNREFVADGTRLAIAESVRGGVTCFNDMYFFPDTIAETAKEMGIRASVGLIALDFPTVWAQNADEYLSKGRELYNDLQGQSMITTMIAPHAPYTVSEEPLRKIAAMRDSLGVGVHIHVHETAVEVQQFLEQHGIRPLARLAEVGLLDDQLAAVHMTQLIDTEIEQLAQTGSHVLHCPESNLKLASGIAPIARLLDASVNVAIGTDGAASNNDLDMLGEIRSAAFTGKNAAENAASLPAEQLIRMATINGAKALGIDEQTGSIEAGKQADLATIDFNRIELQPVYNPVAQIVYSANRYDVSNVWIAGSQLLSAGNFTRYPEQALIDKARQWGERIQSTRITG